MRPTLDRTPTFAVQISNELLYFILKAWGSWIHLLLQLAQEAYRGELYIKHNENITVIRCEKDPPK